MSKHLPAFASEAEEADWWYQNREQQAEEFAQAFAEGRVQRGGLARRLDEAERTKLVTLSPEDALKATILAAEKGLEVQTYLNELLHQAILRETQQVA